MKSTETFPFEQMGEIFRAYHLLNLNIENEQLIQPFFITDQLVSNLFDGPATINRNNGSRHIRGLWTC